MPPASYKTLSRLLRCHLCRPLGHEEPGLRRAVTPPSPTPWGTPNTTLEKDGHGVLASRIPPMPRACRRQRAYKGNNRREQPSVLCGGRIVFDL